MKQTSKIQLHDGNEVAYATAKAVTHLFKQLEAVDGIRFGELSVGNVTINVRKIMPNGSNGLMKPAMCAGARARVSFTTSSYTEVDCEFAPSKLTPLSEALRPVNGTL